MDDKKPVASVSEKAKALAAEYNVLGAFALPKEKMLNPALAGDKTTLEPGKEARWFEIPRTPDGLHQPNGV